MESDPRNSNERNKTEALFDAWERIKATNRFAILKFFFVSVCLDLIIERLSVCQICVRSKMPNVKNDTGFKAFSPKFMIDFDHHTGKRNNNTFHCVIKRQQDVWHTTSTKGRRYTKTENKSCGIQMRPGKKWANMDPRKIKTFDFPPFFHIHFLRSVHSRLMLILWSFFNVELESTNVKISTSKFESVSGFLCVFLPPRLPLILNPESVFYGYDYDDCLTYSPIGTMNTEYPLNTQ